MIQKLDDLEVFKISYDLAMEIFRVSRTFPKEEKYSLTDQLVRSSRAISANIAEGWGKRVYESEFKRHLVYAMGSLEETKVWVNFCMDCSYINDEYFKSLTTRFDLLGAKIYKLHSSWKSF